MSIIKVDIRDRGATPRGMRKMLTGALKESWLETGAEFHAENSDKRFTHAHAAEAGYAPRSKNYERRKLKKYGHTYPLEYSGTARRLSRSADITSTSKGVTIRYRGLRVFNFKNPKSRADMQKEFTTVLPKEVNESARVFDQKLDQKLNSYTGTN
jgi:hypothetical protein